MPCLSCSTRCCGRPSRSFTVARQQGGTFTEAFGVSALRFRPKTGEAEVARRRADYAAVVTTRLVEDLDRLVEAWDPAGGDFGAVLAAAGEEGSPLLFGIRVDHPRSVDRRGLHS